MKLFKISLIAFFAVFSTAIASDFGWTRDFNIQAQADSSGFRSLTPTIKMEGQNV